MINEFRGDYRFLSNFYECHTLGVCASVEHAYQAAKTLDPELRQRILTAGTPGQAKTLGRKVILRPDWEAVKIPTMYTLLTRKFDTPDSAFGSMLLATGDQLLIEGNHWGDTFWGVDIETFTGTNWLGRLLMARRAELRGQL